MDSPRKGTAVRSLLLTCCFLIHSAAYSQGPAAVANINGQIMGLDGKPAAGVRVALTYGVRYQPEFYLITTTDALGRYRLSNVSAGTYFLIAGRIDMPTLYPGTNNESQARKISISSNAPLEHMDFPLVLSPGVSLSGRILPNGVTTPSKITLFARGERWFREDVAVGADGSFIFRGVPPGSYDLSVYPEGLLWNAFGVAVKEKNVTGLRVSATPLTAVAAAVELEDGPVPRFGLDLRGKLGKSQAGIGVLNPAEPAVSYLPAGEYRVSIRDLPKQYRVDSFTYGDTDLLKKPIKIEGAVRFLRLKLSIVKPENLHNIGGHIEGVENIPTTSHVTLSGSSLPQSIQAPIGNDRSYEFSNLLPGTYTLRVGLDRTRTVVLGDTDLQNVDFVVPRNRQLRGRIEVVDGGPLPRSDISFAGESGVEAYGVSYAPGSFEVSLHEGVYGMKIAGFPSEIYEIESITFGTSNLLTDRLQVAGTNLPEILVRLRITKPTFRVSGRSLSKSNDAFAVLSAPSIQIRAPIAPDGSFEFLRVPPGVYTASAPYAASSAVTVTDRAISGVELPVASPGINIPSPTTAETRATAPPPKGERRVRGRVVASTGGMPSRISLEGAQQSFHSSVDSSGQFEFPRVPAGRYSVTVETDASANPRNIIVGDKDLDLEIVVPLKLQIQGRAVIEKDTPLPRAAVIATPTAAPLFGGGGTDVRSDGSFMMILSGGEYRVRVANVPAPYRVKSIEYGSSNLLKEDLKVEQANLEEIVVTFEVIPPVQWAKVAGRLVGAERLPPSTKVVLVQRHSRVFIESSFDGSGIFSFPRVPPGVYSLRTEPRTFGMTDQALVVEEDLENVEVLVPQLRAVTIRIASENTSRVGLSFSIRHTDGRGFGFIRPSALLAPMLSNRVDFECVSDVCSPPPLGRLFNEPVVLREIASSERFTLMLPEGEYWINFNSASGLQSVVSGATNLLKEPFKLAGPNPPEIVLTFR